MYSKIRQVTLGFGEVTMYSHYTSWEGI